MHAENQTAVLKYLITILWLKIERNACLDVFVVDSLNCITNNLSWHECFTEHKCEQMTLTGNVLCIYETIILVCFRKLPETWLLIISWIMCNVILKAGTRFSLRAATSWEPISCSRLIRESEGFSFQDNTFQVVVT